MASNATSLYLALLLTFLTSGCGLIFGEQKIDSKSHDYTNLDLTQEGGWKSVGSAAPRESRPSGSSSRDIPSPGEMEDVAYEHSPSGAVVSLNSVCKGSREMSLQNLSRTLFMGLKRAGSYQDRTFKMADGTPALETTVDAYTMEDQIVRIRAVVLRKASCTFDLMYIARPDWFNKLLPSFNKFLNAFKVNNVQ